MIFKHRKFSVRARFALFVAAGVAGSILFSGCGIGGGLSVPNGTTSAAAFNGKLNGGPNPIQGATIKLYITGNIDGSNGGYGKGTMVQEANSVAGPGQDTGADGSFQFAGGYPCPAGQFLYLVSSGGDTGAGVNPKAFLVAALGRCDDLFSAGKYIGGFIYVNERTTVAAAYALGNFTSITGQDADAQIFIGAPDANNLSVGCIKALPSCATTGAAGLRHAFENALNLVNPFTTAASSTLPTNSSAQVPMQLINSIANTTVSCVNSDGTNASCQTLFAATNTDPVHGNTFQALVNLAKNPTLAGTSVSTSDFLAATTPQTNFYQPFLTSAPADYSISISYPKLSGQTAGTQGLTYPYSGTLDINDNYYIGNYDSAAQTVSNAVSFNSNGTLVSFTPDSAANITAKGASVDQTGDLFLVGTTSAATSGVISKYTIDTTTGAISPTPVTFAVGTAPLTAAAVDRQNNLWIGNSPASGRSISEIPAGQTTAGFTQAVGGAIIAIAVDPNQNIWHTLSLADINHNAIGVVQNVGTVDSPGYVKSNYVKAYDYRGTNASGISFVSDSPFTAYVTNTQNAAGIGKFVPALSGAKVTSVTPRTYVAGGSSPSNNQSDGNGIIWAADGTDVVKFMPGTSAAVTLTPCIAASASANTTCTPSPYAAIQSVSIDAAGSVWFLSSGTGTVNEMIGAAAPTWPLLSLGQLTEPN